MSPARLAIAAIASVSVLSFAQTTPPTVSVPLVVSAGTPLRIQVDGTEFPKKVGDVVHGHLTEPVYAFDKQVLPAGTPVIGRVASFEEAPKAQRAQSILSGHFGSFKKPEVQFEELLVPGAASRRISAATSPSNGQVVELRSASSAQKHGAVGSAIEKGKQQVHAEIANAKGFLKSSNKKEKLRDAALDLLPYRPARIASGSAFDAVLARDEDFGSEQVPVSVLEELGRVTPEDGSTEANLVTGLNSGKTPLGAPVEAVLTAPLFSADHTLLMPEGTRLQGTTTVARPARHFHKNGQLRFSFQQIELPSDIQVLQKQFAYAPQAADTQPKRVRAGMIGLTTRSGSHIGLDDEGTPKIDESKSRFIAPALSVALVAAAGSQEQEHGRLENRTGAQAGAGAFGLGLAGLVIGRFSRPGALVIGSYGAARSVYAQFFGKGFDIDIPSNSRLAIQFQRTGSTLPTGSATAGTSSR